MQQEGSTRFENLLKQTAILAHFNSNNPKKPMNETGSQPTSNVSDKENSSDIANLRNTERKDANDSFAKNNAIDRFRYDATPSYIKGGRMRDYQIDGLNWLISLHVNGINGILADEMGLGKTLQTISLIGYVKHIVKTTAKHLVIVPKSTLQNWMNEFEMWCPTIKIVCLTGEKRARKKLICDIIMPGQWDVCIISYEMTYMENCFLRKFHWGYMVVDEAHRIKNEQNCVARTLRTIKSCNRLLLTGTPMQNNLHELWALLNFLLPNIFSSSRDFDSWFSTNRCLGDDALVLRLKAVLEPFLLRRLKSDVEKELKPKKEVTIFVDMPKFQRDWYAKVLSKDIDIRNGFGKMSKMSLQFDIVHLQKCANHPYLFVGAETGPPYTCDEHLVQNSGKLIVLDKLLAKLQQQKSRVLIFCQMTKMMDILEDYCFLRQYKCCRIDGSTSHKLRAKVIGEFNAENSLTFVFLISTRAGGQGINLASADAVILYDSSWNPHNDVQAMDRAHRIGQKKQVHVYRLILKDTLEEQILDISSRKLCLGERIIERNAELQKIVQLNAKKFWASEQSETTEENIDVIIQRSLEKMHEMRSTMKKALSAHSTEKPSVKEYNEVIHHIPEMETDDAHVIERRRQGDYCSANAYFREILRVDAPKPLGQQILRENQFFPPRLFELLQQEIYYFRKSLGYKEQKLYERGIDAAKVQSEKQRLIDESKPLTKHDIIEKKELLQQGFKNWTHLEAIQFINANELYGRDDIENIARAIKGKTAKEVAKYSAVFWERYHELPNYERIMARIERGEANLKQKTCTSKSLEKNFPAINELLRKRAKSCFILLVDDTLNKRDNVTKKPMQERAAQKRKQMSTISEDFAKKQRTSSNKMDLHEKPNVNQRRSLRLRTQSLRD